MTRNVDNVETLNAKIERLNLLAIPLIYVGGLAFIVFAVSAFITFMFEVDFNTWPQYVVLLSLIVAGVCFIAVMGMGSDQKRLIRRRSQIMQEGSDQQ